MSFISRGRRPCLPVNHNERRPGLSTTGYKDVGADDPVYPRYRRRSPRGRNAQPAPPAQAAPESTSQNIEQLGQLQLPTPESNIYALTVIGQIEGHMILPPQNKTTKYEHVIPQLVAIEQNPGIEGLLIVLNTVGGDVEAGLAIAEMIDTLSKPAVSLVLGGGHSIGVPVAVSADFSFISETATMTVHPLRLTGNIWGIPQTYEYLDKMQDRVIRFVCSHSTITEQKYRELMFNTGQIARDIGTLLVGKDAVEVGLIDQVGGLGQAVARLKEMIRLKKEGQEQDRP